MRKQSIINFTEQLGNKSIEILELEDPAYVLLRVKEFPTYAFAMEAIQSGGGCFLYFRIPPRISSLIENPIMHKHMENLVPFRVVCAYSLPMTFWDMLSKKCLEHKIDHVFFDEAWFGPSIREGYKVDLSEAHRFRQILGKKVGTDYIDKVFSFIYHERFSPPH